MGSLPDIPTQNRTTGGQAAYGLQGNVPNVAQAYNALLKRVAALPFVPSSWSASVSGWEAAGALWVPRYALRREAWEARRAPSMDDILPNVPAWIDTPEKAAAWNRLSDWWRDALDPILSDWASDQAAIMRKAEANAAFWEGLYQVVAPIAEAPQRLASAAGDVVGGAASALLSRLWPLAALGVGALLLLLIVRKR